MLDETNRADMDRVLGGVLTWLSGKKVRVGSQRIAGEPVIPVYLEWVEQAESQVRVVDTPPSIEYAAGSEWRMLGTYNAVDAQRVFRMGQALSRRFKHVPVPPASPHDFERIIAGHVSDEDLLDWFVDRVTRLYRAHLSVEDAQIGPGLLVDVPAYVEKGLQMASYDRPEVDAGPTEESDSTDVADPVAVSSSEGSDPDVSVESSPERDDTLLALREELLAEAYLVSVGNLAAKYEPDLLDELGTSIAASEAMTPANWVWVKENLHAMRA